MQSFGARCLYVFAHHVTPGALFWRTVARQFCVKVAETLMMLCGKHHVLHASLFSELCPCAGAVEGRLKSGCVLRVWIDGPRLIFHDPLMALDGAVDAEVDKHAELCGVPPLHALCAGRFLRLISCFCRGFLRDGWMNYRIADAKRCQGCSGAFQHVAPRD